MAGKFDARSYRDTVGTKDSGQDGNGLTIALACICGLFVMVFTGALVMMNFSGAQAVQITNQPLASQEEVGKKRWTALYKKCERQAFRGHKDGGEFYRAVEQTSAMHGLSGGSAGRLIMCMGAPTARNFCNPVFRKKFNKLVRREMSFTGRKPSDMEQFSHNMSKSIGGKRVRTSIDRRKAITRKLKTLFTKGFLRRDDFKVFALGEPEWLTRMMGDMKQPDPCARV